MLSRTEVLSKILAASRPWLDLGDLERKEILTHLEESIEAKVSLGASEMDAIALALSEFGDLERINRGFRGGLPVATTPWGALLSHLPERRISISNMAYLLLGLASFGYLQVVTLPRFHLLYSNAGRSNPWFLSFFERVAVVLGEGRFMPGTVLLAIGFLVWSRRRDRWAKRLFASLSGAFAVLIIVWGATVLMVVAESIEILRRIGSGS